MDNLSSLENIVLGIISNAFCSLFQYGISKSKEKLFPKKDLSKIIINGFRQDYNAFESISGLSSVRTKTLLNNFFSSSDFESLVRQYFAIHLSDLETSNNVYDDSFRKTLAFFLEIDEKKIRVFSHKISSSIKLICNATIAIAIEDGSLFAHELSTQIRQNQVLDEIIALEKKMELLTTKKNLDHSQLILYKEKINKQICQRHESIYPPFTYSTQKVPLEKIYVNPKISLFPIKKEENGSILFSKALENSYRVVILGHPGGGKSTLASKICHDLSDSKNSLKLFSHTYCVPFLVKVRDYGIAKQTKQQSIIQFLYSITSSTYQIESPESSIEYYLLNGHCIVIFDGLDELLDTHTRQEISKDIESFCNLFPSAPVLVTSREVGYSAAPLDKDTFEVFQLTQFDEEQIADYTSKWFSIDSDLSIDEKQKIIKNFLSESQSVQDLRSNPLLLALMCNIYKGTNYLPKNRPEVYEKCANMLFERDTQKGIHRPLLIEAHINTTMMYIANWIYSDDKLQDGVTEKQLIEKSAEYLYMRRFDNFDEAKYHAQQFVDYCKGRAWVFSDVGTNQNGDMLFEFTHRTFLEYFTAEYLVRNSENPLNLLENLKARIFNAEWDVVAQLTFHIYNRKTEDAGCTLISTIIDQALSTKNSDSIFNVFSFCFRCLDFIIPNPKTIIKLVEQSVIFMYEYSKNLGISFNINKSECENVFINKTASDLQKPERYVGVKKRDDAFERLVLLFGGLCKTNSDIFSIISGAFNQVLERLLNDDDTLKTIFVIETIYYIKNIAMVGHKSTSSFSDQNDLWGTFRNDFINKNIDKIIDHSKKSIIASRLLFEYRIDNFSNFLTSHDLSTIFTCYIPVFYNKTWIEPIVFEILLWICEPKEYDWINSSLENISSKIQSLIYFNYLNNWPQFYIQWWNHFIEKKSKYHSSLKLNTNSLFAAMVIFIIIENEKGNRELKYAEKVFDPRLQNLLSKLITNPEDKEIFEIEKIYGFNEEQISITQKFITLKYLC